MPGQAERSITITRSSRRTPPDTNIGVRGILNRAHNVPHNISDGTNNTDTFSNAASKPTKSVLPLV